MKIYQFSRETGEYTGQRDAAIDPLETKAAGVTVYLNTPFTTTDEPPATGANEVAVRVGGVDGSWQVNEDHRGKTVYNTGDKSALEIEQTGPIPDGYTESEPGEFDSWSGNRWVTDTVSQSNFLKEKQIAGIKAKAGSLILAIAPEWKQRNILARTVELRDIQDSRALTAEEYAEKDAAQAVWDSIKAIRAHSDTLEADVEAGKTVNISSGWPA